MSDATYRRARATVEAKLAVYGFLAAVVRSTPSTGWSPGSSPATPVTAPVRVLETGYSLTNRDDSLVQAGDKVGIISAEGLADPIDLQDKLRIDGTDYAFVDLKPLKPGDVTVLYEFVARRA